MLKVVTDDHGRSEIGAGRDEILPVEVADVGLITSPVATEAASAAWSRRKGRMV